MKKSQKRRWLARKNKRLRAASSYSAKSKVTRALLPYEPYGIIRRKRKLVTVTVNPILLQAGYEIMVKNHSISDNLRVQIIYDDPFKKGS